MKPEVSELVLNAFVDGELPTAEAARIAAVLAADPTIAERVAHLHQIKAALSAMPDDLSPPELPRPSAERKVPRHPVRAMIAGCALLLAIFWSAPASSPEQDIAITPLMAQHDQWVSADVERAEVVWPDGFGWLHPLMEASGLTLVAYSQDGDLRHFGFKGVNACRLSLFVTTSAEPATPLRLTLNEEVQHAQWQLRTAAFEMIARDMAPARFAAIATSLHRESTHNAAAEDAQIAFLKAARLPCMA